MVKNGCDTSLASRIEHTILGEDVTYEKISQHLQEALQIKPACVCIPMEWIPLAKKILANSGIKIVTVVDFPLGAKSADQKATEAFAAVTLGADEIDMVIDYNALINNDYDTALDGIVAVSECCDKVPLKVIIETSALNKEQIAIACALVALGQAQYIKTSTGFHEGGAKVEDIKLMRSLLPDEILIKASGGIRDKQTALAMIEAGADRIGTSKSMQILN